MTGTHRARKRFGQHFLTSSAVVQDIVNAISPRPDDTLLEIGPGHGVLTQPLAASGARLHAVELDRALVPRLRTQFANSGNVVIHEADALRFDYASVGSPLRILGNLPYNISTPLLFRLIEFRAIIVDLHLMLQKEVVGRLAASPGTKAYGRLTIMAGCHLHAEPLFDVPATSFTPPPRVTSTVVRLWPRKTDGFTINDQAFLQRLVTQAFSQRRKTLRNALKELASSDEMLAMSIDPGARAEEIPLAGWVALANHLRQSRPAP
ncbi:MAG: 16S rRNA (adenine(1518)-N(6)/adenine(1519)-N(6))-dimethyltransferase RsmA [Woeseia sp.]